MDLRNLVQRFLPLWIATAILVCTAAILTFQQQWDTISIPVLLLLAMLLPVLVESRVNFSLPVWVQIQYVLLVLAGPYIGGVFNRYDAWPIWDTLVHLYSGFVVSFIIFVVLSATTQSYGLKLPLWFEILVFLSIKTMVAVSWEIAEFIYDHTFAPEKYAQLSNFDTMIDMISGLGPAVVLASMLFACRRKGWFLWMRPVFDPCVRRSQTSSGRPR